VSEETPSRKRHWQREVIAEALSKLAAGQPEVSLQQVADESGIPRSTLQHWRERRDTPDADPAVIAFFESPAGRGRLCAQR
jgi:hypothetical protein